jgi:RND family efflux transporter MFP subunit
MRDRRQLTILVAIGMVAVVAAAIGLASMSRSTRHETSATDVPANTLAVASVVARVQEWPETIAVYGNVVPWDELIVSAQVTNQPLAEVTARVGDSVRGGQVLARFDTAMLQVDIKRLRADVEQAAAEVARANAERDRALQLADSGSVSQQEVVQKVTAAQVAAARLSAARAQLSARELDLHRAVVVAPDAGTISARSAQTGQVGTPGQELFRIIRQDRLEWRGQVTAAQLSRAAPGQYVVLSLPDGTEALARIRHLSPAMDMRTRLATLYADIEPGGPARAGMYVSGRVVLRKSAALVMPAAGIVVRDGHSLAFRVAREGALWRVQEQQVEVGRRSGKEAEILAGLAAGERVVAQGAGFLNDGDVVRVIEGLNEGIAVGDGAP